MTRVSWSGLPAPWMRRPFTLLSTLRRFLVRLLALLVRNSPRARAFLYRHLPVQGSFRLWRILRDEYSRHRETVH